MAKDSRGSTGSSRSSGRKRRSPTIDLSAEEVKRGADETAGPGGAEPPAADAAPSGAEETAAREADAAAETQTEAAESPAGRARSAAAERRTEPEQPIPSAFAVPPHAGTEAATGRPAGPQAGPRRGVLTAGLLAAALAGGLIALAGLFLLDRAGLLPLTDGTEETAALRDRAAELEQEVAAARQAAELAREDLQDQLADLNERVAQLAEAAPAGAGTPDAALDEEVARLQAALTALRDQVGGTAPPAALEDIDARLRQVEETAGRLAGLADQVEALQPAPGESAGQLQERLDQLAARFEQMEGATPTEQDLAAVQDDVAALGDRMGALEDRLAAAASAERLESLEAQLGQVRQHLAQVEALAPAVAAQGLAAALEAGRPFGRELSGIRALGIEDPALSRLEPYAESGLPSRAALHRRFQELMPQIIESAELPPESGTLERLWQSAQQIVEVRPAGPQQGDSPAAVTSRIEAALQAGDLRRALEEWQDLPPDAQAASQDWAAEAGAVLAGEALAERLRSDALAALNPQD